jgi:CheY-like chemotaxis protein
MIYANDSAPRTWAEEEIELVRQVAERTRLAVERLRAEADLRRAREAEAIGRLSREVVHELNNLLMAVSSSLELLRRRLPHVPELLQLVDSATEGVSRGDALTRRLIQAGRPDEAVAEGPPVAPPLAAPADTGETLNILAVDDDALVLMNTVAMLEDLGHDVTPAYSAREALAAMQRQDFDLVVTDHAMPNMTGTQLASEIHGQQPSMPVVLATGYAELPQEAGGHNLPRLSKPFSLAELRAALTRAVAWRSGAA